MRRGICFDNAFGACAFAGVPCLIAALTLCMLVPSAASAQQITVNADVESRDVYVGESFLYQIRVDGADSAEGPDIPALEGFSVEFLGGSNNSSQSISIINGRIQRQVQKGFIFTYRLTPGRSGNLTIPALDVKVEGKTFKTGPITIAVRRPSETNEFKLRMHLSRETCYVGEPVVLTVTWYLRLDVQNFRFTLPVIGSDAFHFEDPEIKPDRGKSYYRISVGSGEVIAEKSKGMLDGVSYATLEFSKVLVPMRPGTHMIPEAIVEAEAVTGGARRSDFFDDFFSDNFFGRRRGRLKKFVTPSNSLSLVVKEMPSEGRPPGFAGHVGEYSISTSASPTTVNVGDPITLKIILEGPDYLGSVDLPPLGAQADLTEGFKIPEERADGAIEGSRKVFTQTIRAKSTGVTEIPPIELVYFDTKKGRYLTAKSDPIPIEVEETKVVTALDAEGLEPGVAGTPLERWKEGIAYNYEGPDLLVPEELGLSPLTGSAGWLAALIVPPALYVLVLAGVMVSRRRMSDPDRVRARGALKRLRTRLSAIQRDDGLSQAAICQAVMEALREYLGDKLRRAGSTLTAGDVDGLLVARKVDRDVIDALTNILSTCEAGSYAGDLSSAGDRESLVTRVREATARLERQI